MSSDSVDRLTGHAPQPVTSNAAGPDESLDFVRFCYRRRRVAWPVLYDEMCAVAARGTFRGLGYAELAERGISFCLPDLHHLAALTEQVILEERASPEPLRAEGTSAVRLSAATAAS